MIIVNIHEAKTRLSQLLAQVEAGEVVIIARAGTPVARLSPAQALDSRRTFGRDRGLYAVPDDFDEPLPEELLEQFFT
ncbi:type II toxin-antitoxin system Phd/YefM family antitoxin [bacterium]|nr:type II toxin-antitoxin system Phd/YefM family antitoxin [bacterium]